MTFQFKPLQKKDINAIINWTIQGMNIHRYTNNKLALQTFTKAFFHNEFNQATRVLALYDNDTLAGVLLAKMNNEPRADYSFIRACYAWLLNHLQQSVFFQDEDTYAIANEKMTARYAETHVLDGEINFLVANPDYANRGIGTQLLNELTRQCAGKRVYLYTDSDCNYRFYEKRGFTRAAQETIQLGLLDVDLCKLDVKSQQTELDCYLYSKVLGA